MTLEARRKRIKRTRPTFGPDHRTERPTYRFPGCRSPLPRNTSWGGRPDGLLNKEPEPLPVRIKALYQSQTERQPIGSSSTYEKKKKTSDKLKIFVITLSLLLFF